MPKTTARRSRSRIANKTFSLNSLVHGTSLYSYNLITHGGLLLSLFFALLYNSFYPVEAFLLPYLLARYLGPFLSNMEPSISNDTVALVSVMMSMILFLQDPTVPEDKKNIFGIPFGGLKGKNTVIVLFVAVLALHIQDAIWTQKLSLGSLLMSVLVGGIIGYSGFSIAQTRDKKDAMIWFVARFFFAFIVFFLLVAYVVFLYKK